MRDNTRRPRKVSCALCGEPTTQPVAIWMQSAIAPGVNAPGSKRIDTWACKSCASNFDDEGDDDA